MFPYYLSIGMTARQFWEQDVWLAKAYRDANTLSIERRNQELWLQGLYNFNAVSTALGNAFSGKGKKAHTYIEKPIRLTPLTKAEREAEARKEWQRTADYFNRLQKQWDSKPKQNGRGGY